MALLVTVLGCKKGASTSGAVCSLEPGDLVISEVMPAPKTDAKNSEWFEVYNASAKPAVLNRLVLAVGGASGASKTHDVVDADIIPSHGYFVFGNGPKGGVVNYSYGGALPLNDTGATISLRCKDKVVSSVTYGSGSGAPSPASGRSISLDGSMVPDAARSEDRIYWCYGDALFDGSNRGTPGRANEPCGTAACSEGGVTRNLVPPAAGDLVVSEMFADPVGADTGKEWIELYVASGAKLDLNGVTIAIAKVNADGSFEPAKELTIASTECVTASTGQHFVVGSSNDKTSNGGVSVDAVLPTLSIPNGVPTLVSILRSGAEIDAARVPAVAEGYSARVDDGHKKASANDPPEAFCQAADTQTGIFDGYGTPGAPNGLCGMQTCRDAATPSAAPRDTVPLQPGDLIITEVFSDAVGADANKEWLELKMLATRPTDLNGASITVTGTSSLSVVLASETCLTAAAGGYVVIGSSNDPALNGGVPVTFVVPNLSFYDGKSLTIEITYDGTLIDMASVAPSTPSATQGYSMSLDAAHLDATSNDDPANFCKAQTMGVFAGYGTPGAANGPCGALSCLEGGVLRTVKGMAAGDVVVTEVFPGVESAPTGGEWLELYVAAAAAVDLNALSIFARTGPLDTNPKVTSFFADACQSAAPGTYVVIAAAATATGGVVDIVAPSLRFDKNPLYLEVVHKGVTIDVASLPLGVANASEQLDGSQQTALANDDPANFCIGREAGSFGFGTPGAVNPPCGSCYDTATAQYRAISAPAEGDLIITEVLPDAAGADANKQWLEVYVNAAASRDLNDLVITNSKINPVGSRVAILGARECMPALPGTYVVIGASSDAGLNGGIPVTYAAPALDFYDTVALTVTLGRVGSAAVIDTASLPKSAAGQSVSLDRDQRTSVGNDDPVNFCLTPAVAPSTVPGTPGAQNGLCGAVCVDGTTGTTRRAVSPVAGELVVTEVVPDPVGADGGLEWVEVYVNAAHALDLNGLRILNGNGTSTQHPPDVPSTSASPCVTVSPVPDPNNVNILPYYLLAGSLVTGERIAYSTGPSAFLYQSGGTGIFTVTLEMMPAATVIHSVTYAVPLTAGDSYAFDPAGMLFDPIDTSAASDWCEGVSTPALPNGDHPAACKL